MTASAYDVVCTIEPLHNKLVYTHTQRKDRTKKKNANIEKKEENNREHKTKREDTKENNREKRIEQTKENNKRNIANI